MGGYRRLEQLCQPQNLFSRMQCPGADADQRALCRRDQFCCGQHRNRIRRRRCGQGERLSNGQFGLHAEYVPRGFDRDRPDAPHGQLSERFGHHSRCFSGVIDAFGPFRQAAQQGELIGQFVRSAALPIKCDMMLPVRHSTGAIAP